MPLQVAIAGASGYAGVELLRLVAQHPELELTHAAADRQVGARIAEIAPHLAAEYPDRTFASFDVDALASADVVFLALPHGASQRVIPQLTNRLVVDLAADFRLPSALYSEWYGEEHHAADAIATFACGLPELFAATLVGSSRIATPGCYPTAAVLALAPLVAAGVIEARHIVINALSGVSGRGRALSEGSLFSETAESAHAYGLVAHRHTPEIEFVLQHVSSEPVGVSFTPHLVPMVRGIVATCVAPLTDDIDPGALATDFYADAPFVSVVDEPQPTKAVAGTNRAALTYRVDPRQRIVVAVGVIDNLVKGTSGQAIQAANLALGFPETTGLALTARWP